MRFNLFVVSESNKRFIDTLPFAKICSEVVIVHHGVNIRKEKRWGEMNVIAIGGGAVIDTAKIISGIKPCVAIPTTASGAAMTNWAVRWLKRSKVSIKTAQPILCEFYRKLDIRLNKEVIKDTYYDCRAHIADSRDSINSTSESLEYCSISERLLTRFMRTKAIADLIDAGNYAGRAINITGTNRLHAMSYVLTLEHNIPHGRALRLIFEKDKDWDWKKIERKARKFKKYYESHYVRNTTRQS